MLYIGAISGTSVDGLDLSIVDIASTEIKILNSETVPFPATLKSNLQRLAFNEDDSIELFGISHAELGTFTGLAIRELIEKNTLDPSCITAIGSHGQTVRHRPDGSAGFSLQIGDSNRIAQITGINTIADFRAADIACGGQGAPLVPKFHEVMFRTPEFDRVVLNIGGIANVTFLPADLSAEVIGFDTGPGNTLMDRWVQHKLARPFDSEGAMAASGTVNEKLFENLCSNPWLSRTPPKSTGKEYFNLNRILRALDHLGQNPDDEDVLATLTQFTNTTISNAIQSWCCRAGEVIVCGGGRLNSHLLDLLQQSLPSFKVIPCEKYELDGDTVEAAAFAYLAHLYVTKQTGNIRSVTGAKAERVLGCCYVGKS
ncbi:MAG: anhydro-N-acetylmuramic acid kinase [Gammaproteobacteria bacterium]|nr:anhydro-N-acetylmuramic acid kinase [Gammaproteobacteria bacterium]